MAYRESARDLVLRKQDKLKALKAGFNNVQTADPFPFESADGTRWPNAALKASHDLDIQTKDQGIHTYEVEQKRLFRKA